MPASRQQGFTLIEVLVALVMAALLTAVLLDGASIARRRTIRAAERQKAILVARSLIARASALPFHAVLPSGTTNGLAWTVAERAILPDPRGIYGLVGIHVAIANLHGAQIFAADARRLKRMPRW